MNYKTLFVIIILSFASFSVSATMNQYNIIPYPKYLVPQKGTFTPSPENTEYVKDSTLGDEEYAIDITKKHCIVKASSDAGFIYAKQTLKQITSKNGKQIPCCTIKDAPQYSYRGLLLDCARHFFPKEEIKKVLDIMGYYKLNRFHWHLSDDHSWRLEIKKYPQLVKTGAYGAVGSHPDNCDTKLTGTVRYEGHYTQEDVKEIVKYASNLGITIIPEIDMPGHITAAVAAMPQLGCTGGPYKVVDVVAPRRKGLAYENLCIGKEETFTFVEDVLKELVELFPSQYIHIGGDECLPDRWDACPLCQQRIKNENITATKNYTTAQLLQCYFTHRVQRILKGLGRKIIGWEEIMKGPLDKGATIMSWRGTNMGIKAAKLGMDAIMTPTRFCYFDYGQWEDTSNEPFTFGKFTVPVKKTYSYNPVEGLTPLQACHIIGVQANVWTDIISTDEFLEYMILPRIAALSEVQWCAPQQKDWNRFLSSMNRHTEYYEKQGYIYAKHLWGTGGLPGHEYKIKNY